MKSYEFKGKTYVFRLSRKARVEIEELQSKQFEVIKKLDPKLLSVFFSNRNLLEEMNEEEMTEKLGELLPYLDVIKQFRSEIDVYEVGFILLKNNLNYTDVNRSMFDEMVFDMEEKLGYEETEDFFVEISDKVFTIIAAQNEKKQKKAEFQNGVKSVLN